jgi:hypothetical protein
MTTTALGTIQTINVRTVWSSESDDFTPWLAEPTNIALLSQAIGVDLDVQAVEKRVGAFRADILCKDDSLNLVLIENQLERNAVFLERGDRQNVAVYPQQRNHRGLPQQDGDHQPAGVRLPQL